MQSVFCVVVNWVFKLDRYSFVLKRLSYFQSAVADSNELQQIDRQKPKGISNISGKKERMGGCKKARLVQGNGKINERENEKKTE